MGLILKNDRYNIKINSCIIIGIMGPSMDNFLLSIKGNNISYIDKIDNFYTNTVIDEINLYTDDNNYDCLDKLSLEQDFLKKKISSLSDSEKHLLRYIIGFISDAKVIIINEPLLDFDYSWKKKIKCFLQEQKNNGKTIIVGSNNSNTILDLSDDVLFVDKNDYYYDKVMNIFQNKDILNKYQILEPEIIKFVTLIREKKNIHLEYTKDIRDLIKDVYKNVSKK